MKVNIQNRPGLQRDMNSGAVINTDNTAYQKALNAKLAAEKKEEELQKKKQDTAYQMISDKEIENNARKDIIDNMKNFFEV